MLQNQAQGLTTKEIANTIGCTSPQVQYIEHEYQIYLDKEKGSKPSSWAAKDEFKHRRGFNDIYQVAFAAWVSNSPELRPNHGVS